jgi:BsuBI/PstI restriction endonuclease domain/BsuBI/PstI restriction endonuclease HTH domain
MPTKRQKSSSKLRSRKLLEARDALKSMGFSGRQQNESAGHTLLALLDLKPSKSWSEVASPLCGITPIIEFIGREYRVRYAPNTRETIRDEAVKYFVEAGLVIRNPDDPKRPTNSGNTVYQIEPKALAALRSIGSPLWAASLEEYLRARGRLRQELMRERKAARLPARLPSGDIVSISPGGQNPLIKSVIEEFCSRFVLEAIVLYIGDAEDKFRHLDRGYLKSLGVEIPPPAKMPDVVVHDVRRNWLLLIEAVTSAGPVDGKRRMELKDLFEGCKAGLVFVTAFENRSSMRGFLGQISWETEVWVADDPDHMIHFDGERFLGPYPDSLPS